MVPTQTIHEIVYNKIKYYYHNKYLRKLRRLLLKFLIVEETNLKKKRIVKIILFVLIIGIPSKILISNYAASLPALNYVYGNSTATSKGAAYPDAKFAVISDTHLYDTSLGTSGSAFEECLNSDRKLLKESSDLIHLGINQISQSDAKFVLVTGDLTKDGELVNHQSMAANLSALTKKGIKVYVIPGNHDVNNPQSVRYDGDKTIEVPNVSAAQFASIYKDCGYGDAVMRDPSSLSYVAQPQAGLWIVALDSCRYSENKKGGSEVVSGRLTQSEETWLEGVLDKARKQGNAVIIMSHHGIIEHWKGQSKLHPDYLIKDYSHVGQLLASYQVKLAFTGHYHAQDITSGDFGQYGKLYDIETGSLITPPCPVRFCTITNNNLSVQSNTIIDQLRPGTNFTRESEAFVRKTIYSEAVSTLKKYFVTGSDADYIANAVSSAFVAHYNGDENASLRPAFDENKLSLWGRIVYSQEKYAIDGLWSDLSPADNNCTIPLQ